MGAERDRRPVQRRVPDLRAVDPDFGGLRRGHRQLRRLGRHAQIRRCSRLDLDVPRRFVPQRPVRHSQVVQAGRQQDLAPLVRPQYPVRLGNHDLERRIHRQPTGKDRFLDQRGLVGRDWDRPADCSRGALERHFMIAGAEIADRHRGDAMRLAVDRHPRAGRRGGDPDASRGSPRGSRCASGRWLDCRWSLRRRRRRGCRRLRRRRTGARRPGRQGSPNRPAAEEHDHAQHQHSRRQRGASNDGRRRRADDSYDSIGDGDAAALRGRWCIGWQCRRVPESRGRIWRVKPTAHRRWLELGPQCRQVEIGTLVFGWRDRQRDGRCGSAAARRRCRRPACASRPGPARRRLCGPDQIGVAFRYIVVHRRPKL